MRTPRIALLILASTVLLGNVGPAFADEPRNEKFEIPAEPPFQVTPMKLELTGRPGEVLSFEIVIAAGSAPCKLGVKVVGFEQDETGTIAVDETDPARPLATLEGNGRLVLAAGGSAKVRGRIVVDAGGPAFRTLGILVWDLAEPALAPHAAVDDRTQQTTSFSLNYALRYVVRLEVRTLGAREPRAAALEIVEGGLVDLQGRALARIVVKNPTDVALEFQVECQVLRADSRARLGPPFPLVLPTKATRSGAARVRAFVLPGARVRLEELVPEPVAPGSYIISVRLVAGLERVQAEFPITVSEQDFPAQAAVLPRVVGSVAISPPRIALSVRKGGARLVPLTIHNRGDGEVALRFVSESFGGDSSDWLVIRPATLTLPAGASRRVAVTLQGGGTLSGSHYALLRVEVAPKDGAPGGAQRLPVAFTGSQEPAPMALVGAIEPVEGPHGLAFAVPVANQGAGHLVLDGTLTILDPFGRKLEQLHGGFGEWVLPGENGRALFALTRRLPPGEYMLKLCLYFSPGGDPILVDRAWREGALIRAAAVPPQLETGR